mmetsp:Transcript_30876/g.63083  ORF Transcript_30876/g.63083 Transcript_30876/m.63083 type:complete len:830 (-) Transcript_30876:1907-4396(-)
MASITPSTFAASSWTCQTCTFENDSPQALACLMCLSERKVVDFNNRGSGHNDNGMLEMPSVDDDGAVTGKCGNQARNLKISDGEDLDGERRSDGVVNGEFSGVLGVDGGYSSSSCDSTLAGKKTRRNSLRQSSSAVTSSDTRKLKKTRPLSDFFISRGRRRRDQHSRDNETGNGDENFPACSEANKSTRRRSSHSLKNNDRDDGQKSVTSKYFPTTSHKDGQSNYGDDYLQPLRFPDDGRGKTNQTNGDIRGVQVKRAVEAGKTQVGVRDGRRDIHDGDFPEGKETVKCEVGEARSEPREWDAFASLEKNLQNCDDSDSGSSRDCADQDYRDSLDEDRGNSICCDYGDGNSYSGDHDKGRGHDSGSRRLEGYSGSDQHSINGAHESVDNEEQQWDAFKSFQENYESSDDSDTASGEVDDHDGSSDEDYRSDDCFEEESDNYHDGSDGKDVYDLCDADEDEPCDKGREVPAPGPSPPMERPKSDVECIDLADTDDDGDHCQLDDHVANDDDSKSQHQRMRTTGKRSRLKRLSSSSDDPPKVTKTIRSLRRSNHGVDSDSSLSEIGNIQPQFSPGRSRPLPPWQRSTRGTTSASATVAAETAALNISIPHLESRRPTRQSRSTVNNRVNKTKPVQSFPCMNQRNDVVGGSGAGINGFTVSNRNADEAGDDEDLALGSGRRKNGGSTSTRKRRISKSASAKGCNAAAGTKKSPTGSNSSATTSKSRKRKSGTTPASSNTVSSSAPKKRRRRSYNPKSRYRRSAGRRSTGSGRGGASSSGWTARERGIRDQHGRGRGKSSTRGGRTSNCSGTYMNIVKQEPMLRGIGGASIQL